MIIIGGINPTNDTFFSGSADDGSEPVDPWPEGIGIFDMTALRFKDSYEANAKQYETPELIKEFYNDTDRYPATWSSPAVQKLFQTRSNQPSNVSSSETPIPSNSSIPQSSHLSSFSIAGIVIGAIVFITLCAIAILIVRKKRKNTKLDPRIFKVELLDEERHRLPALTEMPGLTDEHGQRSESANTGIIELSDREHLELP